MIIRFKLPDIEEKQVIEGASLEQVEAVKEILEESKNLDFYEYLDSLPDREED